MCSANRETDERFTVLLQSTAFSFASKEAHRRRKVQYPISQSRYAYDNGGQAAVLPIQKSLLQREVAEYAGINESTYIHYENPEHDYYPIDKLSRIAELLEVDVTDLLDEYNRFLYDGQGWQIRKIRKSMGLTQYQFGKLYSVSAGAVKRWESGKVRVSKGTWEKIGNHVEN